MINYHPTSRRWYTLKIRDEPGYSPLLKCSRMLGHVRSHPKLYIVVVICWYPPARGHVHTNHTRCSKLTPECSQLDSLYSVICYAKWKWYLYWRGFGLKYREMWEGDVQKSSFSWQSLDTRERCTIGLIFNCLKTKV